MFSGLFLHVIQSTLTNIEPILATRADAQVIEETKEPTLEERATLIAREYGISPTTLKNLVASESAWNPNAIGDNGDSVGLVQIRLRNWPNITKEQALDPEFSLRFAAQKIKEGKEWLWSPCSCIKGARNLGVNIPIGTDAQDLKSNSVPTIGSLILLKYENGVSHVGVIQKITDSTFVFESYNRIPCLHSVDEIGMNSPFIVGFWSEKV